MGAIHDIRFERLAREAADKPLLLCREDEEYVLRHLSAVGAAFALHATPEVPLNTMGARALARHVARLRTGLEPATLEQQ